MKTKNYEMHNYLQGHFTQEDYNFLCHMVDVYTEHGAAMEKAGQENTPDPPTPWELLDENLIERWLRLGARKMLIEQQITENRQAILKPCQN